MLAQLPAVSGQERSQTIRTVHRWTTNRFRAAVQSLPDEALLRLIAERNQLALEVLFKRHNVRIFRFALAITKDRALAEGVVSDVFFDIWRRPGSFAGRSQVSTWLLAIARNKAFTALTRHAYSHAHEELAETIEDATDNAEVALQREQAGAILAECLRGLSTAHREIIDLVYYHQKSIEDVAEILDIPTSTVKTRMFYARRRIAEMLGTREEAMTAIVV